MKLLLQRHISTEECTTGDLYLNGQWYCYTLEDVVRKDKIKGKTAIPCGLYKVTVNWSKRFQRPMPILLDVPNFTGVRIHTGNYAGFETFLKKIPLTKQPSVPILNEIEYVKVYSD